MEILLVVLVAACFAHLACVLIAAILMFAASALQHRFLSKDAVTHDDMTLARSRFAIPVSIIAPAFNEELPVVASIRSLLALDYREFEVIVVNDGSSDGTLDVLTRAFNLEPRTVFYRQQYETQATRGTYRSRSDPRLTVVDKENGGKADALNAGLNLARYRYICTVDSDTVYFKKSLLHSMRAAVRDPATVVGVTSSVVVCRHPQGDGDESSARRIDETALTNWQFLDYLRAFMNNRLGWSGSNFMLCSVGAFAIWRRDVVEQLGGFSRAFTCEDIEFTFRVHEYMRREKRPYRIVALAESVGWTEGPDTIAALIRQRARWHRVITETVWHYRRMLFNPRYGAVGLIGVPYYVLVEVLAPIFAVCAAVAVPLAWWLDLLDWRWFAALLIAIALWNGVLTNLALLLHGRGATVYLPGDLQRLMILGFTDLFGYRPIVMYAQVKGLFDFLRGRKTWDKFERNRRPSAIALRLQVFTEARVPGQPSGRTELRRQRRPR